MQMNDKLLYDRSTADGIYITAIGGQKFLLEWYDILAYELNELNIKIQSALTDTGFDKYLKPDLSYKDAEDFDENAIYPENYYLEIECETEKDAIRLHNIIKTGYILYKQFNNIMAELDKSK